MDIEVTEERDGEALVLLGGHVKAGVGHAERSEDQQESSDAGHDERERLQSLLTRSVL